MAIKLTKKQFSSVAKKAAEQVATIQVAEMKTVWTAVDGKPALAIVCQMVDNGVPHFPLVYTTDGKRLSIACGNPHLSGEGEGLVEKAPAHVAEAVAASRGTMVAPACRKASFFGANLAADIRAGSDLGESRKKYFCPHEEALLVNLPDDAAEKLLKEFSSAMRVKGATGNAIADTLAKIAFKGEALLIVGDGGSGKTFTVREYAEATGLAFVEVHGHQQIEALDLYGHIWETPDGRKVWKDGPVSRALRRAAEGEKVLLFIDEFANIPMREAAGLKAAFEPYKGRYVVHTGRIVDVDGNGIGKEEVIEAPVENLQIVAASNFGAGYASEELDRALKQRFLVLHYEASEQTIKEVLLGICKERSFSPAWADRLIAFAKQVKALQRNGFAEEAPTMRHLSRKILQLAESEEEIAEMARLQLLQFVEFDLDGRPVQEQVEAIEDAIDATLAA